LFREKTLQRLIKSRRTFFRENFFDPADEAACEAHFDSMRMGGGPGENILNDTFGEFAGALILFPDNLNPGSRFNIRSFCSTHLCPAFFNKGSGPDS